MWSGLVRLAWLEALGRSTLTACVSSGAVMMKMTSSTSITSISGIMLISAIGAGAPPLVEAAEGHVRRPFAAAGLQRHHGAGVRRRASRW